MYRDPRTGATLGGALREWREVSALTVAEAAGHCDIALTHLIDIESDLCGPTANVLASLASLYDRNPDISAPGDGWATVIWWLQVFTEVEATTNRQRLDIVAESIREMRGLKSGDAVRMRDAEGDILISMLDLTQPQTVCDIMAAFALSASETQEFIGSSVRRIERRQGAHEPILSRIDWSCLGAVDTDIDSVIEAA